MLCNKLSDTDCQFSAELGQVSAAALVIKLPDNRTATRSKAAHCTVRALTFIKLKLISTGDSVTFCF